MRYLEDTTMHMIERLTRAIEANEAADKLAMTCAGLHDARRLDQMVCDADNLSRDFVRRHGREIMQILDDQMAELLRLRGQLANARLAIVEYGAHKGECAITDIDDGGLHYYCDCGYEAAIDAAADKALGKAWQRDPDQ